MENAVEALKTAFAVLVFIIAITTSFTMFGKAKKTVDSIVTIQDKQGYLESPTVDGGILYTSSSTIGNTGLSGTMTTNGDRIVGVEDVISTIYRYNLEKYGVTIVESDGTVLARFDSNTENIMRQWYNITAVSKEEGGIKSADEIKDEFAQKIQSHLANTYTEINITQDILKYLYNISVDGNSSIQVGAPWYGNEAEIIKRCNVNINGGTYKLNNQKYEIESDKSLMAKLEGKTIVEVVNEIDNSKYVQDEGNNDTTLLQEYQLPTIEIIYIIQ